MLKSLRSKANAKLVGVAAVVMTAASNAMAQGPDPITISQIEDVIDIGSLGDSALLQGGNALGVAFTIGGGFRIAKKAFSWIFNKM